MKKEEGEKEGGGKEERVKAWKGEVPAIGGCGDGLRYGVEEKERREEKKIGKKFTNIFDNAL